MRHVSKSRPGFTLVELLVVIGIIALLISILLPALGRARGQAQMVQCSSNMRGLGQALTLYFNDSKERLPPMMVDSGVAPEAWPAGFFWANVLARGKYASAAMGTTAAGAKNQLSGVFTCPGGTDTLTPSTFEGAATTDFPASGVNDYLRSHNYVADSRVLDSNDSSDRVGTHYMLNARKANSTDFFGAADTAYVPPFYSFVGGTGDTNRNRVTNDPRYSRKLGQMRNTATLVMVFEGNAYEMNRAPRLAARHQKSKDGKNGMTNMLFFDGHVGSYPTKPYYDAWTKGGTADTTGLCFFVKNHGVAETRFRLND